MTGTHFPPALGTYLSHAVSSDGDIGGRVHVELEGGVVVSAETWPPDTWDDVDLIDWNDRITVTVDERDARELLSPGDFEELRDWMIDTLAAAGALTAPRKPEA